MVTYIEGMAEIKSTGKQRADEVAINDLSKINQDGV
jgi:hypothetical protein